MSIGEYLLLITGRALPAANDNGGWSQWVETHPQCRCVLPFPP